MFGSACLRVSINDTLDAQYLITAEKSKERNDFKNQNSLTFNEIIAFQVCWVFASQVKGTDGAWVVVGLRTQVSQKTVKGNNSQSSLPWV
jgi:hypothetical protein